jgi:hypothetical protein
MNLAQISKSMSDYINRENMLITYLCTVKKKNTSDSKCINLTASNSVFHTKFMLLLAINPTS